MFEIKGSTPIVKIKHPVCLKRGVKLWIKREDLIDEEISGNKFRKLKYNLAKARDKGYKQLLTFGGAYSNHIFATAAAGNRYGFKTMGIIRGEEILPLNPTLKAARKYGMKLHYIARSQYRNKYSPDFLKTLREDYGEFYLVPEGGSNALAVKGCTEMIGLEEQGFDTICLCCGTGGTMAGVIAGLHGRGRIIGFPVLKGGEFLYEEIEKLLLQYNGQKYDNWKLMTAYHMGGYAKFTWELIRFINKFKSKFKVQLDPVYTGKMLFGVCDLIKKGFFKKGEKILAIHTGGLQGIKGFNERFGHLIHT
jgi:1-aminocyclopropane-1-carboxylate deaminase/D-cysteine desulfhydrase-like pyridoxal-dependent ACC family enzyme